MSSTNDASEKNRRCLLKFEIPLVARRAVIGDRGYTIKNIGKRNNVKIELHRKLRLPWLLRLERDLLHYAFESHGMPNDYLVFEQEVSVIIQGTEACCKRAQAEILLIVTEKKDKVFVREFEFMYAKLSYVFRDISSLKEKYPLLILETCSSFGKLRIKGAMLSVKLAEEEIVTIQNRVEKEIHKIQIRAPTVVRRLLMKNGIIEFPGRINENNVWIGLPISVDDQNTLTICGPEEAVKTTELRIYQAIEECVHHTINASNLILGDLAHVRVVLMIVRLELEKLATRNDVSIIKPKIEELEDTSQTSYVIEVAGKQGDVETYKVEMATLVGRIIPEKVAIISDCDPNPALHGMYLDLMDVAKENHLKLVFLDGNMYIVDEALAKGNVESEKELAPRLTDLKRLLPEWRDILETLDKTTLSVPSDLQKYLNGPGGTTMSCLKDLFEGKSGDVLLHHNEIKELENEIHVQGPKEAVQKIIEEIARILKDIKETGDYRLYESQLIVPSSVVSGLIGKNRRFWRDLKESNCVQLRVIDQGKGTRAKETAENSNAVIAVSGIELNVKNAIKQISKRADELADEHVLRVEIDRTFLKRIAGPGYINVNMIEIEFDVEVRFYKEGLRYPCPRNPDEILIHGRKNNVAGATKKIIELYDQEKEHACQQKISVPPHALFAVLEDLGEVLWDRSDQFVGGRVFGPDDFPCSGVDYKVELNEDICVVTLLGRKEVLDEAILGVHKLLESFHVTTISVPRKHQHFLDRYSDESRWYGLVSEPGGFSISRKQQERLIKIPEEGELVTCCGDKTMVEGVIENVKRLVEELEGEAGKA